jgi:hypothetical protein
MIVIVNHFMTVTVNCLMTVIVNHLMIVIVNHAMIKWFTITILNVLVLQSLHGSLL